MNDRGTAFTKENIGEKLSEREFNLNLAAIGLDAQSKKTYYGKKEFEKFNVKNDQTHNSLALCIGDAGFFLSYELMNKKYNKDKNFSKLLSYYNEVVINTCKGEVLDIYLPFIEQYDKNHILI